jgi:tRNA (mo5U34)-methyltransferase
MALPENGKERADSEKLTPSPEGKRLENRVKAFPFWYHKITLPYGVVTPGWAPIDAKAYGIPERLDGLRVLDVGAWDGYWTFEALRRGAREAVAIDDFSDFLGHLDKRERQAWQTFDLCREALGYDEERCKRFEVSVYEVREAALGHFDVVFLFGTLYHLRHPLLALDRLASLCDGEIYVESAILDDFSPYRGGLGHGYSDGQKVMEFYPGKEYGNNDTNWWTPTLNCLESMVAAAGFSEGVRGWKLVEKPKSLALCRGFVTGRKPIAQKGLVRTMPSSAQASASAPLKRHRNTPLHAAASVVKIVDVGAAALHGAVPFHLPLTKLGKANVIGFEPIAAECERLNATAPSGYRFLPYALGDGSEKTLRVCNVTMTSSLYEPNQELLSAFQDLPELMQVVSRQPLMTKRLDDVPEAADADFLKLDVQGAELDVIRGASKSLGSVLVVQTEVEFVPLYESQPLFADVDIALRAHGFVFHKFLGLSGRAFKPFRRKDKRYAPLSQILWADAVYVRDFTRFGELVPDQLLKLALVLVECYGSVDLASVALSAYDRLTGDDLGERYLKSFQGD